MKKSILFVVLFVLSLSIYSQDQSISGNLNVSGIINVNDKSLFKMKSILARLPEGGNGTYLGVKSHSSQMADAGVSSLINVKSFSIDHMFYETLNSSINFYRGGSTFGGSLGISVYDGTEYFRFSRGRLDVDGLIRAKEVKIEAVIWPDFVFDKEYVLPDLKEVENHIKEHKHLPGIPSEGEVKENGVSVGEMQAKLLQKIEELTLYVIDLKKENEKLEKRINELSMEK